MEAPKRPRMAGRKMRALMVPKTQIMRKIAKKYLQRHSMMRRCDTHEGKLSIAH